MDRPKIIGKFRLRDCQIYDSLIKPYSIFFTYIVSCTFLVNYYLYPMIFNFQYPLTFSEDDLNTIVQMGFGQTDNRKTPIQFQNLNGNKPNVKKVYVNVISFSIGLKKIMLTSTCFVQMQAQINYPYEIKL